MIRTVTLNPAIDQTVVVERLEPGAVHRASAVRFDAGGKGVNVASCLADWGSDVRAAGLLGTGNWGSFKTLFAAKRIEDVMVAVPGETRTNIKILDGSGETTDLNLPGFSATEDDLTAVEESLADVQPGDITVVSGSHPAGLPADASRRLVAGLRARGARVVLDVSGAALAAALDAPAGELPEAVKPNRHELETWAGRAFTSRAELLAAARDLVARGVGLVVVSLGTDGALFVTAEGACHAAPLEIATGSSVGAGDSMVAGLASALADGLGLAETAQRAAGFAAGKLSLAGPNLPPPDAVLALADRVAITPAGDWAARDPATGDPAADGKG